jgi:hypothetical protein
MTREPVAAEPDGRREDGRPVDLPDRLSGHGAGQPHGLDLEGGLRGEGPRHGLHERLGVPLPEPVEELAGEQGAEERRRRPPLAGRERGVHRRDEKAVRLPRREAGRDLELGHAYFFDLFGT